MVTTVIKTIGAGKDYATPTEFFTYTSTLDLVALDQVVIGEMYDAVPSNAFSYKTFSVKTSSPTCYAILRPASALSWKTLDPNNGDYGTLGMEFTAIQNAQFIVRDGCVVENFRIKVSPTTNYSCLAGSGTFTYRGCKFLVTGLTQGELFNYPEGSMPNIRNNVFYIDGMKGGFIFSISRAGGRISRNTFIARNGSVFTMFGQGNGTTPSYSTVLNDNIFAGFTSTTIAGIHHTASVHQNFTDAVGYVRDGFIVTTEPLVTSLTDARPAVNSPALKKASSFSFNSLDIFGANRGYVPDCGAYQVSPVVTTRPEYVHKFPKNLNLSDPLLANLLVAVRFNEANSLNVARNNRYSAINGGNATIRVTTGEDGYTYYHGRGYISSNGNADGRLIFHKPFSLFLTTETTAETRYKTIYSQAATTTISFGINMNELNEIVPGMLRFKIGTLCIVAPNAVDGTKATYGVICSGSGDGGATLKLVKNGEVLPSVITGTPLAQFEGAGSNGLQIAGVNEYTHQSLSANIYDFSFFDKALTDAETVQYYSLLTELPPPPPDYVMPAITMSASNTNVVINNEVVVLTALATDDVGVKRVVFKRDGVVFKNDVAAPYTADVPFTREQNGSYVFTSIVEDTYGNQTESAPLTVVVNIPPPDLVNPTISITSNVTNLTSEVPVIVTATAADNYGVKNVKFYMDNVLVDTITKAPYTTTQVFTYKQNGVRVFKSIVSDTSDNTTTSNEVSVTINIPAPPPGHYTIGPGRDYANLSDFVSFVNGKDLVAEGQPVVGWVYANQTITNMTIAPANANASCFVTIKPATGLGVNAKDNTGAFDYGTTGIELTINGSKFTTGNGVLLDGFRVNVPEGVGSVYGTINTSSRARGFNPTFTNCRFRLRTAFPCFGLGEYANATTFKNCLIIQENNWSDTFVGGSAVELIGCTIARRNHDGVGTIKPVFGSSRWYNMVSCLLVNASIDPSNLAEGWRGSRFNVSDSSANWVNTSTNGFTFSPDGLATSLVVNLQNDLRPKGVAIGAGGQDLVSINDIRGENRGLSPDAGTIQFAPAVPLSVGTLTGNAPLPDGQTMKYVGTVTNSPITGTVRFTPATPSLGAINVGPVPVTLGADGTFQVEVDDMPPGKYNVAEFVFRNDGGSNIMTLGVPFEINGMSSAAFDNGVVLSITGDPFLPQ